MKKYECYYLSPSKHILNNLSLLSLTSSQSLTQVKLKLQQALIPKLCYFIIYHSLKSLTTQYQLLNNWYPPHTLSDQIEFKKISIQIIIKLQNQNKISKIINVYSGDKKIFEDSNKLINLLRYLTQFALRQSYICNNNDLIQVSLNNQNQGINKYYPQSEYKPIEESTLQIFQTHIQILKNNLLQNLTFDQQSLNFSFNFQELRLLINHQNEIRVKMFKIPKELFSQNKEYDRIQVIDKLNEIWSSMNLDLGEVSVGENQFIDEEKEFISIDEMWEGWLRKVIGDLKEMNKIRQQEEIKDNQRVNNLKRMLKQMNDQIKQLKQFKLDIEAIMMD